MTEYELVSETVFTPPTTDDSLRVEIPDSALEVEVRYSTSGSGAKATIRYLKPVEDNR